MAAASAERRDRSMTCEAGENLRFLNGNGVEDVGVLVEDFIALRRNVEMIGMDFRPSKMRVSFSVGRVCIISILEGMS